MEITFYVILLIIAFVLVFLIFSPFITPLILAVTFAVIFDPIHRWVLKVVGDKKLLAALLTTLIALLIILIPLFFVTLQIFQETRQVYNYVSSPNIQNSALEEILLSVQTYINHFVPGFVLSLGTYLRNFLNLILNNIDLIFSELIRVFFQLFLAVLAFFYLVKDGEKLKQAVVSLSPLKESDTTVILDKLRFTINSVIRGSMVVAIMQGIIAGSGFAIFKVPNPVFWGSLGVFASFIPSIGTSILYLPAIIYLFAAGKTIFGIGLLIWWLLVISLVDNVLSPFIIHRSAKIHPFLILLAVVGGIGYFGPVGFLIGPIILSFLFSLLDIYRGLSATK